MHGALTISISGCWMFPNIIPYRPHIQIFNFKQLLQYSATWVNILYMCMLYGYVYTCMQYILILYTSTPHSHSFAVEIYTKPIQTHVIMSIIIHSHFERRVVSYLWINYIFNRFYNHLHPHETEHSSVDLLGMKWTYLKLIDNSLGTFNHV